MCKLLIVLIPAYEPDDHLTQLLRKLYENDITTIVVDDGSGKQYSYIFKIAEQLCEHVVTYPENMGKGYALKVGLNYIFNHYKDCIIVTMDADGQHNISDAIKLYKTVCNHIDSVVLGKRDFTKNVPFRSQFGNTTTRLVFRCISGVKVYDTQTGLRAFHSTLIPFMLDVNGLRYEYEINVLLQCAKSKIPIIEVPIETVYFNNNSSSHFNAITDSYRVYKEIIKFALSSFLSFLIDYTIYSLLVLTTSSMGTAISVIISNIIARFISATINFSINRQLVFKSDNGLVKSAVQYATLAIFILMGNTLLLTILVQNLYIDRFIAKILTEVTFFILSWFIQKMVVFRKKVE